MPAGPSSTQLCPNATWKHRYTPEQAAARGFSEVQQHGETDDCMLL